jgi:hypothetical protein
MSQREKAGLSWPGFSVAAGEPFEVGPRSKIACWPSVIPKPLPLPVLIRHSSRRSNIRSASFASNPLALGVAQPESRDTLSSVRCTFVPFARLPEITASSEEFRPPFGTAGVGHAANCACSFKLAKPGLPLPSARHRARIALICSGVFGVAVSWTCGVGQPDPPQPLSDVRSAEARSAQIDRPEGVIRSFQVSRNKVEPLEAVAARNLLSKDRCRAALRDETEELRPEVASVVKAASLAGCREGLAGAGAGPDGLVIGHAGHAEREAPAPDAGEEMALPVRLQVGRSNIDN